MRSPRSPGIVSIKKFVKGYIITEIFIFLEQRIETIYRALSLIVFEEDLRQAPGEFGANLVELLPGAWSSQRHWHERQDEFIYVVEGEVTLVTNEGETILKSGMFAGFRAGVANGHHLANRSNAIARVLEVGTRTAEETAHYPDIGMMYREGEGYLAADGRPLK